MKWDKLPQRFFTDDFMNALYQRYNISCTIQEVLCDKLERSARDWFYLQAVDDRDASAREVRETLSKISQAGSVLQDILTNTPGAAWSALSEASRVASTDDFKLGIHYTSHQRPDIELIETPEITVLTNGETSPFHTIQTPTLIAALSELASSADVAAQLIPTVKKGPQPNLPLEKWILSVRNLWYWPVERPFTLDVVGGEPVSEAACFCVEVYAQIAPKTPKSRILNEMKKRISADKALNIELLD